MNVYTITFKGEGGKVSVTYLAGSRKEALRKAMKDGAIVISEISEA